MYAKVLPLGVKSEISLKKQIKRKLKRLREMWMGMGFSETAIKKFTEQLLFKIAFGSYNKWPSNVS